MVRGRSRNLARVEPSTSRLAMNEASVVDPRPLPWTVVAVAEFELTASAFSPLLPVTLPRAL